jgi:hypothetical protein
MTWRLVYYRLMRKFGKGKKVEALLTAILQDVLLLIYEKYGSFFQVLGPL